MTDTVNDSTHFRASTRRIAVFVDVQSLFFAAKNTAQSKVEYGRLLSGLVGQRQLTRAIAYLAQRENSGGGGFCEALLRTGYEVRRKDLPARTEHEFQPKWSWVAGMCVDALALASRVDTIVLASVDGTLAPLIDALKAQGCRVEVAGTERGTAEELIQAANEFIPIRGAWLFKEAKFAAGAPSAMAPKRNPLYEGLPDDDDLDMEAAALAARQKAP